MRIEPTVGDPLETYWVCGFRQLIILALVTTVVAPMYLGNTLPPNVIGCARFLCNMDLQIAHLGSFYLAIHSHTL